MLDIIKDIIGVSGNEYDYFLMLVCAWITVYFVYLLFNLVSSVVNRV